MLHIEKGGLIIIMLILFMSAISNTVLLSAEKSGGEDIIVVMDIFHNPALSNFSKAFKYLNESLGGRVRLYKLNESLAPTYLSGVAMYVVPPFRSDYDREEIDILRDYVRAGGIVIILGMDYVAERDYNPEVPFIDNLVAKLSTNVKIRYNYTKGLGNTIIDPLSEDTYLHINEDQYSDELKKFLGGKTYSLIVESCVLTIPPANMSSAKYIKIPEWAYAITGDGTILYFESGATIFAIGGCGKGLVLAFGFALSISDVVEKNYNKSWIDLAQNKEFWVEVIKHALAERMSWLVYGEERGPIDISLIWKSSIALGSILVIIGGFLVKRRPTRKPKRKVVKISEILRRTRERGST